MMGYREDLDVLQWEEKPLHPCPYQTWELVGSTEEPARRWQCCERQDQTLVPTGQKRLHSSALWGDTQAFLL